MFSFKQFTIRQDRTAMKVCTDACVLGAYADVTNAGSTIPVNKVKRILDIGTGTGLLALMAAQRNLAAAVDAVEVDEDAFGQATENVAASPFSERVKVLQGRIQEFRPTVRYDRILTNPPFYTNHLRSPESAVNRALHTDELSFPELVESVGRLLQADGQWWVLLPPYEMDTLTTLANQAGLYAHKRLLLRHNAQKPVFRVISGFTFEKADKQDDMMTIFAPRTPINLGEKSRRETYTSEFRTLLHDFYLIF